MDNSFSRDIQIISDGILDDGEWSSTSESGTFTIDLENNFWISEIILYWSGGWGRDTHDFAVELSDDCAETGDIVYETTEADYVKDRVDVIDLTSLGTARNANKITLHCRNRNGNGYALFEIVANGVPYNPGNNFCSSKVYV